MFIPFLLLRLTHQQLITICCTNGAARRRVGRRIRKQTWRARCARLHLGPNSHSSSSSFRTGPKHWSALFLLFPHRLFLDSLGLIFFESQLFRSDESTISSGLKKSTISSVGFHSLPVYFSSMPFFLRHWWPFHVSNELLPPSRPSSSHLPWFLQLLGAMLVCYGPTYSIPELAGTWGHHVRW